MTTATDRLDAAFSALSDPTRRAILTRLAHGEATVLELAEPFSMSLPAVSKHLKVLERSGLIARGREGQWRPCKLVSRPLKEAHDWLRDFERHWVDRLDRLGAYLDEVQAVSTPTPSRGRHGKAKRSK
ncbi:MAG: metalloregulator ArsR/SmtB family transcription factor [Myxococcaceae bacterium]